MRVRCQAKEALVVGLARKHPAFPIHLLHGLRDLGALGGEMG